MRTLTAFAALSLVLASVPRALPAPLEARPSSDLERPANDLLEFLQARLPVGTPANRVKAWLEANGLKYEDLTSDNRTVALLAPCYHGSGLGRHFRALGLAIFEFDGEKLVRITVPHRAEGRNP